MSGHVKLSRKAAEALLGSVDALTDYEIGTAGKQAAEVLRAALKPRLSKPMRRARVEGVRAARAAKNAETASIRAEVFARAGGRCELCRSRVATDMHHAFGRVKAKQAVSNCLALCRACHADLTDSRPDRGHWIALQVGHFLRHGYAVEALEMGRALHVLEAKKALGGAR